MSYYLVGCYTLVPKSETHWINKISFSKLQSDEYSSSTVRRAVKNHVQNFLQVFTGQTWTNQKWQPITNQRAYDERASVALEVDPKPQMRELNTFNQNRWHFFSLFCLSASMLNLFSYFINTLYYLKHSNWLFKTSTLTFWRISFGENPLSFYKNS